jgi:signal transduction histidine kinase
LLDVNAAIAEAHALLARTIVENIELLVVPSPEPLMIRADGGRIQQVLVNLAVNARDAMPDGGTLVIEGTIAELDEHQTGLQPGLQHSARLALPAKSGSRMKIQDWCCQGLIVSAARIRRIVDAEIAGREPRWSAGPAPVGQARQSSSA